MLGVEQKDWPANTLITGFCYYDADGGNAKLPAHLEEFLSQGEPPVVFTLGSAAVLAAGEFYEYSARAAIKAGVRAVLLIGSDPRNRPPQELPESICVAEYAPYSALFPRTAMVVHQGGVGTTAQCLQAGKPMLIMPYSHDQPDNARRMRRLGVARVIRRDDYKPMRAAAKIRSILEEPKFGRDALQVIAKKLAQEHGVQTACDALEELWKNTTAEKLADFRFSRGKRMSSKELRYALQDHRRAEEAIFVGKFQPYSAREHGHDLLPWYCRADSGIADGEAACCPYRWKDTLGAAGDPGGNFRGEHMPDRRGGQADPANHNPGISGHLSSSLLG